ncbi:MAG: tyrosine-type recombinase/integrase, partial [Pseudonocardiaceae bacterium]
GLRIGEALGLRHEDLDARRRLVAVRPRVNVNRARAKTWSREVPADTDLFRLYSDYLHEEYGPLDCDYVFVNLWGAPVGAPMSYAGVDRLVHRLRGRTGVSFSPHLFRHSYVISPDSEPVRHVGYGGGRARALGVSGSCRYPQLPSPRDRVDQCRVPGRAGGVAARRRRVVGGARR